MRIPPQIKKMPNKATLLKLGIIYILLVCCIVKFFSCLNTLPKEIANEITIYALGMYVFYYLIFDYGHPNK